MVETESLFSLQAIVDRLNDCGVESTKYLRQLKMQVFRFIHFGLTFVPCYALVLLFSLTNDDVYFSL
jgi:hypothetical protein